MTVLNSIPCGSEYPFPTVSCKKIKRSKWGFMSTDTQRSQGRHLRKMGWKVFLYYKVVKQNCSIQKARKGSLSLIVKSSTFNRFHVFAIDDWNISNNLYLQKFLRRSTWVTFHCGKYFTKSQVWIDWYLIFTIHVLMHIQTWTA